MQLNVTSNKKHDSHISIDKYPDECPFCHRGIDPNLLNGFRHFEKQLLHLDFFCPRLDCNRYFIGEYEVDNDSSFCLKRTLLGRSKQKVFSETIIKISSDFVEIFYQADIAEQDGLNQICGVGYRKALEFLIKDYIIYKDNDLKDIVEKLPLGKCMDEYIQNERIKDIAKRATWIGNDETHYVRKWIGKSIIDLKLLIDLTVHWIETEDLTDKMISSMPG